MQGRSTSAPQATARPATWPASCSGVSIPAQLFEQRLSALEISCIQTLGKPSVDSAETVIGFATATALAKNPGEANGSPQFPELSLLLLGDCQGLTIKLLGSLGIPLPQHQLALVPIQFRYKPALPDSCGDLQGVVEQRESLLDLSCDLACPSQQGGMIGYARFRTGGA